MSPLAALYTILPFLVLFFFHQLEEAFSLQRWLTGKEQLLYSRFPRLQPLINHFRKLPPVAFPITAAEEMLLLLVITSALFIDVPYSLHLWTAFFMVFSFHLPFHFALGLLLRDYVPGLVTALFSIPFVCLTIPQLLNTYYLWQLALLTLAGLLFMSANLFLVHRLCTSVSRLLQLRHKR